MLKIVFSHTANLTIILETGWWVNRLLLTIAPLSAIQKKE